MSSLTSQMQAFVTSALDVVEFKLVREAKDLDDAETFHPEMAHQIFGDEENIFGYKDLKIHLYYSAGSLDLYYHVQFSKKIDDLKLDDMKADNIDAAIEDILPVGVPTFTNLEEFCKTLEKKNAEFRPMGDKLMEFEIIGSPGASRVFEIYVCNMNTANFLKYHAKLESFLFWYVDAASRIMHDSQWEYFLVFEKYKNSKGEEQFASVGYSTVYLYYSYPENTRPRISQMLVLPPFQRLGIGSKIIEAIYKYYGARKEVNDICVEEPSPVFQHMRSTVDAKLCCKLPEFAAEKLKQGLCSEMINAAKKEFKINPRQCRIVYEILRLAATNRNNPEEYKNYRLEVKKRLNMAHHKQKRELLKAEKRGVSVKTAMEMLPTDEVRLEQLQLEYKAIEESYLSILKKIAFES